MADIVVCGSMLTGKRCCMRFEMLRFLGEGDRKVLRWDPASAAWQ